MRRNDPHAQTSSLSALASSRRSCSSYLRRMPLSGRKTCAPSQRHTLITQYHRWWGDTAEKSKQKPYALNKEGRFDDAMSQSAIRRPTEIKQIPRQHDRRRRYKSYLQYNVSTSTERTHVPYSGVRVRNTTTTRVARPFSAVDEPLKILTMALSPSVVFAAGDVLLWRSSLHWLVKLVDGTGPRPDSAIFPHRMLPHFIGRHGETSLAFHLPP